MPFLLWNEKSTTDAIPIVGQGEVQQMPFLLWNEKSATDAIPIPCSTFDDYCFNVFISIFRFRDMYV